MGDGRSAAGNGAGGIGVRVVGVAWLVVLAAACADGDGEVVGGAAPGPGSSDGSGFGDGTADGAVDAAPEASTTADDDAGSDTAEPADAVAPDAADAVADAPADAAPVDTGPDAKPDTAKPDTGGDPCPAKLAAYTNARAAALACTSFWECTVEAADGAGCPCQIHYSSTNLKGQAVIDAEAELKKLACKPGTCGAKCLDPVTSVGVCQPGAGSGTTCKTYVPTCKELETLATSALQEGAKCTADADCGFKVSNTLGCGCPTFVNLKTMGPGKPLFQFMIQLVNSYKAQKCTSDVACSCPNPNSATCVAGKCMPKG